MEIAEETVDDLLNGVFSVLLKVGSPITPTRGAALEITSVLLRLKNPRARLSLTETKGRLFSCLGELLWYLSGTNDLGFIAYYLSRYKEDSEDEKTIYGAYGPRLLNMRGKDIHQINNVLSLLGEKKDSRRAVIQLFDAEDLTRPHKEIPCTCTLQFMVRNDRLEMLTSMRSNDAFLGLPHDIFAFTMLQEIMARSLGVELGAYSHVVGSLHLYEKDFESAQRYLREGLQSSIHTMLAMPTDDPWPSIANLLRAERSIREATIGERTTDNLPAYWADLVRLLQIFAHSKREEWAQITNLRCSMATDVYNVYIDELQVRRKRSLARNKKGPES